MSLLEGNRVDVASICAIRGDRRGNVYEYGIRWYCDEYIQAKVIEKLIPLVEEHKIKCKKIRELDREKEIARRDRQRKILDKLK